MPLSRAIIARIAPLSQVSRKKLVFTVDDDCRPAVGPDGNLVNAVKEHARNLLSPAVPYFFNTVHDPCVLHCDVQPAT